MTDTLVAMDIAIEPGETMVERSLADNAKLLENFPQGYSLDDTHHAHISILQRFVRETDLATGKVEITSQNHGFCVLPETLPADTEVTHVSLFDGTNEGLKVKDKPVFSVQYHPEASPGPQDSHYLFKRFTDAMKARDGE